MLSTSCNLLPIRGCLQQPPFQVLSKHAGYSSLLDNTLNYNLLPGDCRRLVQSGKALLGFVNNVIW